ncbi:hypothetical protein D3C74_353120 [compost metagenome]
MLVPVKPLGKEQLNTVAVRNQHVDAEVNPVTPPGQHRHPELKVRPNIQIKHPVEHYLLRQLKCFFRFRLALIRQVAPFDPIFGRMLQQLLDPIRADHGRKHRMKPHQTVPGLFQFAPVELLRFNLLIELAAAVAAGHICAASEYVSLLLIR